MAEVQGLRLHHVAVPIGALEQPAVLYPNLLHISHAHLHVEGASARDGHAASDIGLRPLAAPVPPAALDGVEDPPDVAGHRLEPRIVLFHPGVGLLDILPVLF